VCFCCDAKQVEAWERESRVGEVLCMLGLEAVGEVVGGGALVKGISGGQARRLTIGVEIINLPDLIFLDEPTTGLDSNVALEVTKGNHTDR
jgi:ABC-type multidrug transport system ATPase subunit